MRRFLDPLKLPNATVLGLDLGKCVCAILARQASASLE
jgi:hypothetical protein